MDASEVEADAEKFGTFKDVMEHTPTRLKKLSENSGCRPSREEKGLGSSAARPMENAQCTGRLDDH